MKPVERDRDLGVYLNDHLAGSAAALQLARRRHERERDTELGGYLRGLIDEIEEDRQALERLMARVGAATSQVKQAGARGAELLTRLRHRLPVVGSGSDALVRLEEIELLCLGIEGKRLLWRALGALAGSDERVSEFDFAALEDRAKAQRDGLEPFRVELAARAFGR